MSDGVSFNINAELYENRFGELAIRFPGEKVYAHVGTEKGSAFVRDCVAKLENDLQPDAWNEIPAHQLLYGNDWHCICRMGYLEGDETKPGVEFEVKPEEWGTAARQYLKDAL